MAQAEAIAGLPAEPTWEEEIAAVFGLGPQWRPAPFEWLITQLETDAGRRYLLQIFTGSGPLAFLLTDEEARTFRDGLITSVSNLIVAR